MKVAVFGHYDSRGGTTAIKLPDNPTEADVRAVLKRYDKEMFGIEDASDTIQTTVYGMEARVVDQMVHKILYPDTTPSVEDFMYVAELHGVDDSMLVGEGGTDLEETGAVLIDNGTDWDEKRVGPDEVIEMSVKDHTQLEYVKLEDGWDADIKLLEQGLEARATAVGVWIHGCNSAWTAEQVVEQKKLTAEQDELQTEREARIVAMAKVLKGDKIEYRRWDDDAFGFILIP